MTPLKWPHSPSCPQTLSSSLTSPAASRRWTGKNVVVSRFPHRLDRSSLFGASSSKLYRCHSCELPKLRSDVAHRRASSASLDAFSDEEFSKQIQELAMKFQLSDDSTDSQLDGPPRSSEVEHSNEILRTNSTVNSSSPKSSSLESVDPQWPEIRHEPPEWPMAGEEIVIERKANSVDLPLSLRMIKKKKQSQWQEGFRDTAYCSVKKAFASLVFIIRELHSYTFQMRELLFYEDLQGILTRVQQEMHASFVWLFQQIFSHTPTLMVSIMILLANFTVHSVASNVGIVGSPDSTTAVTTESVLEHKSPDKSGEKFDPSTLKTFSVSGSGGSKSTSVGGNHGGGGKAKQAAGGTDGDGWSEKSGGIPHKILPDGAAYRVSPLTAREEELLSGLDERGEEVKLWDSVMEEASRMQEEVRGDSLDFVTVQRFVSPVTAKIESDEGYTGYFRSKLLYQTALVQEPNNPLLLANFAQFLYLVAHDYDRAEEYFKKATEIEPKDAEAFCKYANFLWHAKKDLWAAEETFLEAISADPGNTYYAGSYANFLWNTGGEDTCFPLENPEGCCDA